MFLEELRASRESSREQKERRGGLVVARFFSGGLWVLEVWTRETGTWTVLMSQVTTAKP